MTCTVNATDQLGPEEITVEGKRYTLRWLCWYSSNHFVVWMKAFGSWWHYNNLHPGGFAVSVVPPFPFATMSTGTYASAPTAMLYSRLESCDLILYKTITSDTGPTSLVSSVTHRDLLFTLGKGLQELAHRYLPPEVIVLLLSFLPVETFVPADACEARVWQGLAREDWPAAEDLATHALEDRDLAPWQESNVPPAPATLTLIGEIEEDTSHHLQEWNPHTDPPR